MPSNLPANQLLLPIPQVAERLTGRRPSPATVWRWLRRGVNGVRLDALYLGGRWLTTETKFREFLRSQTEAQLARTSRGASDDELADAGLL